MANRSLELVIPKIVHLKYGSMFFSFPKGHKEEKKAFCTICKAGVVHAGGTTNLKTHLHRWHHSTYDELFQDSTEVEATSPSMLENYKFVSKRAVTPISIVNDTGFLNLLQEAEPRYVVPCRITITRSLSELHTSEKRRIRETIASADFVSCTTDMWSSHSGDGYISLTCHFITPEFKMCYHNLQAHHFPGRHDHVMISQAFD